LSAIAVILKDGIEALSIIDGGVVGNIQPEAAHLAEFRVKIGSGLRK
jgi:hypothetical protein